ncbi:MAG TPA: AAA family ATPase, partial [Candidatus Obscuribacter sp.]|nr:AAA family ATPase [Candidatus Obscuribacter sp.]
MLKSIHIRDFALIENTLVEWTSGLNVLTGETGAGKSILMDALSAVLGGKVAPSIIRPGKEKAAIEACFLAGPHVLAYLKQEELLADDESEELVVAREISKSGSKVRVNGTLVNSAIVSELRGMLMTVHAQHEARTLMTPQSQLELLDGLGGDAHQKVVDKVRTLYLRHKDLSAELNGLTMSEEDRLKSLDFANFQLKELTEAELLSDTEDEELEREISVLVNAIDLKSQAL